MAADFCPQQLDQWLFEGLTDQQVFTKIAQASKTDKRWGLFVEGLLKTAGPGSKLIGVLKEVQHALKKPRSLSFPVEAYNAASTRGPGYATAGGPSALAHGAPPKLDSLRTPRNIPLPTGADFSDGSWLGSSKPAPVDASALFAEPTPQLHKLPSDMHSVFGGPGPTAIPAPPIPGWPTADEKAFLRDLARGTGRGGTYNKVVGGIAGLAGLGGGAAALDYAYPDAPQHKPALLARPGEDQNLTSGSAPPEETAPSAQAAPAATGGVTPPAPIFNRILEHLKANAGTYGLLAGGGTLAGGLYHALKPSEEPEEDEDDFEDDYEKAAAFFKQGLAPAIAAAAAGGMVLTGVGYAAADHALNFAGEHLIPQAPPHNPAQHIAQQESMLPPSIRAQYDTGLKGQQAGLQAAGVPQAEQPGKIMDWKQQTLADYGSRRAQAGLPPISPQLPEEKPKPWTQQFKEDWNRPPGYLKHFPPAQALFPVVNAIGNAVFPPTKPVQRQQINEAPPAPADPVREQYLNTPVAADKPPQTPAGLPAAETIAAMKTPEGLAAAQQRIQETSAQYLNPHVPEAERLKLLQEHPEHLQQMLHDKIAIEAARTNEAPEAIRQRLTQGELDPTDLQRIMAANHIPDEDGQHPGFLQHLQNWFEHADPTLKLMVGIGIPLAIAGLAHAAFNGSPGGLAAGVLGAGAAAYGSGMLDSFLPSNMASSQFMQGGHPGLAEGLFSGQEQNDPIRDMQRKAIADSAQAGAATGESDANSQPGPIGSVMPGLLEDKDNSWMSRFKSEGDPEQWDQPDIEAAVHSWGTQRALPTWTPEWVRRAQGGPTDAQMQHLLQGVPAEYREGLEQQFAQNKTLSEPGNAALQKQLTDWLH